MLLAREGRSRLGRREGMLDNITSNCEYVMVYLSEAGRLPPRRVDGWGRAELRSARFGRHPDMLYSNAENRIRGEGSSQGHHGNIGHLYDRETNIL
jgi:hypothetical protein